jgi:hypothetical protein
LRRRSAPPPRSTAIRPDGRGATDESNTRSPGLLRCACQKASTWSSRRAATG